MGFWGETRGKSDIGASICKEGLATPKKSTFLDFYLEKGPQGYPRAPHPEIPILFLPGDSDTDFCTAILGNPLLLFVQLN